MWVFYSGSGVIKGSGSSGVCAGQKTENRNAVLWIMESENRMRFDVFFIYNRNMILCGTS